MSQGVSVSILTARMTKEHRRVSGFRSRNHFHEISKGLTLAVIIPNQHSEFGERLGGGSWVQGSGQLFQQVERSRLSRLRLTIHLPGRKEGEDVIRGQPAGVKKNRKREPEPESEAERMRKRWEGSS